MTSLTPKREAWGSAQRSVLDACIGQTAVGVTVVEMGMFGPDEAPVFTHPELKFVQASILEIAFADRSALCVSNWQDDDWFALRVERKPTGGELLDRELGSLFRVRPMAEFPLGLVEAVHWQADERGDVQEIELRVAGRTVWLCAGEVSENMDGTVTIQDREESVLIFLDGQARRDTAFGSAVVVRGVSGQ